MAMFEQRSILTSSLARFERSFGSNVLGGITQGPDFHFRGGVGSAVLPPDSHHLIKSGWHVGHLLQ